MPSDSPVPHHSDTDAIRFLACPIRFDSGVRFQMLADDAPVFNLPVRFDFDEDQLPISSDSDAIRFVYFR
jgi:hypothetical protein